MLKEIGQIQYANVLGASTRRTSSLLEKLLLMGANLGHQNLICVVPCVGAVDYPVDEVAEPMKITVLDQSFLVHVQYHHFRNITYVLLDAPIFRAQSKSEPYPARMDDLDSAIYYSAWNSCIAETLQRFSVDLYHIND